MALSLYVYIHIFKYGRETKTNQTKQHMVVQIQMDDLLERPPYAPAEAFLTIPRLYRNLSDPPPPHPEVLKIHPIIQGIPKSSQGSHTTRHKRERGKGEREPSSSSQGRAKGER